MVTIIIIITRLSFFLQPPFDGDDDDQLFNNIMEKPVHYPRGMSDPAKKCIQGVSVDTHTHCTDHAHIYSKLCGIILCTRTCTHTLLVFIQP